MGRVWVAKVGAVIMNGCCRNSEGDGGLHCWCRTLKRNTAGCN